MSCSMQWVSQSLVLPVLHQPPRERCEATVLFMRKHP